MSSVLVLFKHTHQLSNDRVLGRKASLRTRPRKAITKHAL